MQGFFKQDDISIIRTGRGVCDRVCKLSRSCQTYKLPYYGEGSKQILLVGEAPGTNEDKIGRPFVGRAGQTLRDMLRDAGVDMDLDCWRTNAVKCHPPSNRKPLPRELETCRPFLYKEVSELKPSVIILLGATAIQSYFGHRLYEAPGAITRWRGFAIPDHVHKCWVIPTFHPSYVMREEKNKAVRLITTQDLSLARQYCKIPLPPPPPSLGHVEIVDPSPAIERMKKIRGLVCIDFETTGKKPHRSEHSIISCALTTDGESAFSFFIRDNTEVKRALADLFLRPGVRFIGANIKFENAWAAEKIGIRPRRWAFDTCIGAHVLDNREGITSVKFQAAIRLGLFQYNSQVEKYLKAPKSMTEARLGANAINSIESCDYNTLLKYNGMDVLVEWRLAMLMAEELGVQLK